MKVLDAYCVQIIRSYCDNNGLNFAKVKDMVKCSGKDFFLLQYHDPNKGDEGLYDETRMPVVLQIIRTNGKLLIHETEHTRKFLAA